MILFLRAKPFFVCLFVLVLCSKLRPLVLSLQEEISGSFINGEHVDLMSLGEKKSQQREKNPENYSFEHKNYICDEIVLYAGKFLRLWRWVVTRLVPE